jgi:putative tryptophan/tyrosine transport system substrate-binding protein
MRRRDFITLLGVAAASLPLAARAQQRDALRRVAILEAIAKDTPGAQERYTAFLEGFEQLGWTPGRNVRLEPRWGGGDEAATRRYVAELIALTPDVLVAGGGSTAELMLKATHSIPIVFVIVPDPVGSGFVEPPPTPSSSRASRTIDLL